MIMGPYDHRRLKSLLGAWALAACAPEETAAVEAHLTDCAPCADEALRLRDAVRLLHPQDNLDLDPALRSRVLELCLTRRMPGIPMPGWSVPYDAETARLDALLHDMGEAEWGAPVQLAWYDDDRPAARETSVAGVIGHLLAVDGLLALALGLPDPLAADAPAAEGHPRTVSSPAERTEALWQEAGSSYAEQQSLARQLRRRHAGTMRGHWRDQTYALIRTAGFAGGGVADLPVRYGAGVTLPLRDAFLDRAFACWIHAWDVAEAVDYPYVPPTPEHMHLMIDLAARLLPETLAHRRRSGRASPPRTLVAAGTPGRTLHLEVEGKGGGNWYIPLDSPAAVAGPERTVAHVALEGLEFCRLAAGHVSPEDAAAGRDGDREAVDDFLYAAVSLSRM
ncbi:zf-HC2 domain-containing protein [Streptomyces synnematoformans]|uniref:Zf-HC2 domain-containing protein n=1 Tax=Streptomyces synnematoformans TaxID=415721 RepID=A0ABP5KT57_9ACTN